MYVYSAQLCLLTPRSTLLLTHTLLLFSTSLSSSLLLSLHIYCTHLPAIQIAAVRTQHTLLDQQTCHICIYVGKSKECGEGRGHRREAKREEQKKKGKKRFAYMNIGLFIVKPKELCHKNACFRAHLHRV